MNQLYLYLYPHIPSLFGVPPTLPIPPLYVVTKQWADLPVLWACFPLAINFTLGGVYMSTAHFHFVPAYPSPSLCPQVHYLRLCLYSCPTPRFIRTFFLFRFHIYVLAYGICFSLSDFTSPVWLTLVRSTEIQITQLKKKIIGLPWWRSGWESACQCRGHGFEPWSGRIPHAAERLGPWVTIAEPVPLEPVLCNEERPR